MQENIRHSAEKPEMTVGIDLGDRFSRYCVVNQEGEVIEEGRVQTTMVALERHFTGERQRIAMECGTHSPWVSRLLQGMGHEVLVANARKVRAITDSESKNDHNDAEKLARFAAYDVRLLSPIQHRSPERQRDLNLLQARDTLVRARTMLVNAMRGLVKSAGQRLPKCSTESFARTVRTTIPAGMEPALTPLLEQVASLTEEIRKMDKQIEAPASVRVGTGNESAEYYEPAAERDGIGGKSSGVLRHDHRRRKAGLPMELVWDQY